MKEYNYNGIRYKRDNNGQWQYFDPTYNKWVYTYYNAPSINGTAVYDSDYLEKAFKAKDPWLKETTTQKVEQDALNAKKAQDRSSMLNNPLIPTDVKIKQISNNAPTVENANTLKQLQVQKQKEDEKAAKQRQLDQQEEARIQALRTSGSDNTRVNNMTIPEFEIKNPIEEWETITKAQKREASRIVNTGDFAKHFPELRDYYLSKENSHRPGGPLTMEEIVLEKIRTDPNFFQTLDNRKFEDFKKREQAAYDDMNFFEKGVNFVLATAADPIQTPWNLITRGEGPLAMQGYMSVDPELLGDDYQYFERMTHKDDGLMSGLNDMVNFVNPFRAAVSTGHNLAQGNYGEAAWDAATIIPAFKGAKLATKGFKTAMKANPTSVANYLAKKNVISPSTVTALANDASPLMKRLSRNATVERALIGYGGYEGATHFAPEAIKAYSKGDIGKGNENALMALMAGLPIVGEASAVNRFARTEPALQKFIPVGKMKSSTPVMSETSEFAPVFADAENAASYQTRYKTYRKNDPYNEYEPLTKDEYAAIQQENPNIVKKQTTIDRGVPLDENPIYSEGVQGQIEAFDDSSDFAINWGVKDIDEYNSIVKNNDELSRINKKIDFIVNNKDNKDIVQKASDINKTILDKFLESKNITFDEFVQSTTHFDPTEFAQFENQQLSTMAAENPELINILKDAEMLQQRRSALFSKKRQLVSQIAESAESAIDPVFKEKVKELYRLAGIPENQIPTKAFEKSQTLISDFGKGRAKLVEMNQYDPLSDPAFRSLPDQDQMYLANEWARINGVRTTDSTITLGSSVSDPLYYKVQRRPEIEVSYVPIEPPREFTPWKPWTWKNRNFVPRTKAEFKEVYKEDPTLLEETEIIRRSPEAIGGTNVHEFGHDYQNFYNRWADVISKYDPDYDYVVPSEHNAIAKRFKDALIEPTLKDPKTGTRSPGTWTSSPIELHSNLMKARYEYYLKLKKAKPELSQKQIINMIKNGEAADNAEIYDFYIQQLSKHFKESTPPRERKELLKILPVLIPAIGYGVMEGMNQDMETETPQNRYGGNIKKLSKFIRK